MWDAATGLTKSPEALRADLERMIELERQDKHGDPDCEAKVWLDKLAGVDQERRSYLKLPATGQMSDEEVARHRWSLKRPERARKGNSMG